MQQLVYDLNKALKTAKQLSSKIITLKTLKFNLIENEA